MSAKRLYRSRDDRMIAGVAGGLGEYFDIDPVIFRLIFVLLTIGGGAGILLYLLAWIIIPEEPAHETQSKETTKNEKEDFGKTVESRAKQMADEVQQSAENLKASGRANTTAGLILLVIGVLFLLQNLTGFNVWGNLWPLILVAIGLSIILKSATRS